MKRNPRTSIQEDLFDSSRHQELQRCIRELDIQIAQEMKQFNYEKARQLTEHQEQLIQELVIMNENGMPDQKSKSI
jgi:hypothetical protein